MSWSVSPAADTGGSGAPGWTVTPAPPAAGVGGWLNFQFERAAALAGSGSLSAVVKPIVPTPAGFRGDGAAAAAMAPRYTLAADFSSRDTSAVGGVVSGLSAWGGPLFASTAALTGDGLLYALNGLDGFTADVYQLGSGADTAGGEGTLAGLIYQLYTAAADFSGDGSLSAPNANSLDGLSTVWAQLYSPADPADSVGTLALLMQQIYTVTAAFAGAGALSALVQQLYATTAVFAGSGALSAATSQLYSIAIALAGAGALAVTWNQVYSPAAAVAGSGTLAVTWQQIYSIAASLAGAGTLSVTWQQNYSPAVGFGSAGTLSVTAFRLVHSGNINRAPMIRASTT